MSNLAIPQPVWDHEVPATNQPAVDWLWHGFIAHGQMTLLTSQWKAGKTTLLAMLLSRRKAGGNLAGLAVQPGKTVIISEEPMPLWTDRIRHYDFGGQVCFFCQPFRAIPSPDQWQLLLDQILALRQRHPFDLAVIDPLAPFCLGENQTKSILDTLMPLRQLTSQGMAVLVLHHPAKGEKLIGQAARGSGALLSHVDISIEMRHPGGDPFTRRRRFQTLSRHAATPRQLLLELNPDATDYLPLPDTQEDDFPVAWPGLRLILEDADRKLTRQNILDDWSPDFDKPERTTLWRCLERAVARSLVSREGTGRKNDPFHYWLPEREAVWKRDPLYEFLEEQRRLVKSLAKQGL